MKFTFVLLSSKMNSPDGPTPVVEVTCSSSDKPVLSRSGGGSAASPSSPPKGYERRVTLDPSDLVFPPQTPQPKWTTLHEELLNDGTPSPTPPRVPTPPRGTGFTRLGNGCFSTSVGPNRARRCVWISALATYQRAVKLL